MKKIIWGIRAFIYKFLFKKIKFPSYIGKPIYIKGYKNISIGSKVRIYPGIRIEVVDKNSFLSLEDNISIGQNCHIVSFNDELLIEKNVTISGNVLITNCDHNYEDTTKSVLEQNLITKRTKIRRGIIYRVWCSNSSWDGIRKALYSWG